MRLVAALATLFGASPASADASRAPAAVKSVFADPSAADRKARGLKPDDDRADPFYFNRPFDLSPQHIALMRKSRFIWDFEEKGAPALDPAKPFGEANLMAQLAQVFGRGKPAALAVRHVEMVAALRVALRQGTIRPGAYVLKNIDPKSAIDRINKLRSMMPGKPPPVTAGFAPDGRFELTEDHVKLLRAISVRWAYDEAIEAMAEGDWPAARIDAKRPYGDRSYFTMDMAEALGAKLETGADGKLMPPAAAEDARLMTLHAEMLGALQAFVEHADIAPGRYE